MNSKVINRRYINAFATQNKKVDDVVVIPPKVIRTYFDEELQFEVKVYESRYAPGAKPCRRY